MNPRVILDLSGPAREELSDRLAAGGLQAAALGHTLDRLPVAAFSLGLAETGGQPRDASVLAGFALAFTRSARFVVGADPARQHPINLARSLSTLNALHRQRVGLALHAGAETTAWFRPAGAAAPARAADYLRLVSSLWDSWPLDAIVGDTAGGRYVDAGRIVRIADPAYPSIGGPLTLPTDQAGKPPLLLVGATAVESGPGVDVALQPEGAGRWAGQGVLLLTGLPTLDAVLAWQPEDGHAADAGPGSLRTALGLSPSGPVATAGEHVFRDPDRAAQLA